MDTRLKVEKTTKRTFTIWPVLKDEDKGRYATDESWTIVLFAILLYWIYAIYRHTYFDTLPADNTTEYETSHLVLNETDYNIIDHREIVNDSFEISHHEAHNVTTSGTDKKKKSCFRTVDLVFILAEAITCNLSYLEENQKKWEFALGIYLLMSFELFLLGMCFLGLDEKMFSKQPSIFGAVFLFVAFIERLSVMYNTKISVTSSWWPSHEKLICWVLPETVILITWLSKMFSAVHYNDKDDFCDMKSILLNEENDVNDSAIGSDDESIDKIIESSSDDEAVDVDSSTDSDNGSDTESVEEVADEAPNDRPVDQANENNGSNETTEKSPENAFFKIKYVYKIIPFHYYTYAFIFSFSFVIILKLLMTLTFKLLPNADWPRSSYIIAGGSIYLGLIIFHFGLMLTACATNMLIDSEKFTFNDLHRAVYIVSRYHFGSACYHAVPVIAMAQASEMIMSSELITYDPKSLKNRTLDKYGTKLSRTIIGVRGYNHAESVKELMRIVNLVPMQDYFYSFGPMAGFLLTFLLPINSLMVIFLWYRGVYDSHFAKASWVMYLTMTFTFYLVMKFFKTASNTIGLRLCEREVNKRERFGEV